MIPAREVLDLRTEWSLDVGVIEKDYVLGWLLAGIANEPDLARTWVFKGGTCLRKCYYETYRFSEDLDFTVIDGGHETPDDLTGIFGRIGEWLREEAGIDLLVDDASFRARQNKRGNPTAQGRIAYRGPNQPPQLRKVKLDITSDEVLVERPELRAKGRWGLFREREERRRERGPQEHEPRVRAGLMSGPAPGSTPGQIEMWRDEGTGPGRYRPPAPQGSDWSATGSAAHLSPWPWAHRSGGCPPGRPARERRGVFLPRGRRRAVSNPPCRCLVRAER